MNLRPQYTSIGRGFVNYYRLVGASCRHSSIAEMTHLEKWNILVVVIELIEARRPVVALARCSAKTARSPGAVS
jgi:hypothetical protein